MKTEFALRTEEERRSWVFPPVPPAITPYLWPENTGGFCYAIVNASISFHLPADFEHSDLQYACLFKGEQAELQKYTAPYLLKLPQNHSMVRALCAETPDGQPNAFRFWYSRFGFFFRSHAEFDEVLHHFRKFVYMKTYDGRLLYFRFYDPSVLEDYFDRLQHYPKKLSTFFGGGLIEAFIFPKGINALCYRPNIDFSAVTPAIKQFDRFEMKAMIARKDEKLLAAIVDDIIRRVEHISDFYSKDVIEKAVRRCHELALQYRIKESRTIGLLAIYSLAGGCLIDILDPQKQIPRILTDDKLSETQKLYLVRERIEHLERQGLITNKFGEHHD